MHPATAFHHRNCRSSHQQTEDKLGTAIVAAPAASESFERLTVERPRARDTVAGLQERPINGDTRLAVAPSETLINTLA